jgi:hypothetical protein
MMENILFSAARKQVSFYFVHAFYAKMGKKEPDKLKAYQDKVDA